MAAKVVTKAELVARLHAEFKQWEVLLAGLTEPQATDRAKPGARSVKDDLAHLWA